MTMRRFALLVLFCLTLGPALAVQPDEVLSDPALEARARALSAELRCLICQSQSIDDSDATIARDLRVLIRERLQAGDTDSQVKAYLVDRYGEYVLLRPAFAWHNAILWGIAPLALVLGGGLAYAVMRRGSRPAAAQLTAEEEARLAALLAERDRS